jgi:hypothetical protein
MQSGFGISHSKKQIDVIAGDPFPMKPPHWKSNNGLYLGVNLCGVAYLARLVPGGPKGGGGSTTRDNGRGC